MAIRFCKGNYIISDINKVNDVFESFFQKENEKYIIITKNKKIYGYMDKNKKIYYDFVKKDNCFNDGHKYISKYNLEYIPLIDNNKVIGFCYDDSDLDDVLNKIKDLILFSNKAIFNKKYSNIIIYGYNELAYYLEKLFNNLGLKYKVEDDIFRVNGDFTESNATMKLYVEGNNGLSLNNYSYWKVYHEWIYECMNPIYDIYEELNKFKYDDEKHIVECLNNNHPFMMARLGNTELWVIKQYLQKQAGITYGYSNFWLNYFFNTSGFFSINNNLNDVDRYAIESIEAIKNCDFNLCYGNDELAEGLNSVLINIQKDCKNYNWNLLTNPFTNKWFKYLKNKKVLIISPYSESIKKQIKNLDKLYYNKYPDISITTYQCLQTQLNNNNGYNSFFEAIEKMKTDIAKIEFDVAFVCAGAYGYLLASYIKNIGKSSIELCSYLPNWFGIKIKRYCTYLNVNKYWNKDWIFPLEKPLKNSNKIEDSCYWE